MIGYTKLFTRNLVNNSEYRIPITKDTLTQLIELMRSQHIPDSEIRLRLKNIVDISSIYSHAGLMCSLGSLMGILGYQLTHKIKILRSITVLSGTMGGITLGHKLGKKSDYKLLNEVLQSHNIEII